MPSLNFEKVREDLVEQYGKMVRDVDVISASMYPKVTNDYLEFKEKYGPVDALDTRLFLVGPKVAQEFEVRQMFCKLWWTVSYCKSIVITHMLESEIIHGHIPFIHA